MVWLIVAIAAAVLLFAAIAGSGRFDGMPDVVHDIPQPREHEGPLTADDVRGVRFAVGLRGYSIDQVDEFLERLSRQLDRPEDGQAPGR